MYKIYLFRFAHYEGRKNADMDRLYSLAKNVIRYYDHRRREHSLMSRFINIRLWVLESNIPCEIFYDFLDNEKLRSECYLAFENEEHAIECVLRFGSSEEAKNLDR